MSKRRFPVLDAGFSIPWELVEPFEAQARRNHDQSLETLASRGGLSPAELWAVMNGKNLRDMRLMSEADAEKWARSLLTPSGLTLTPAEVEEVREAVSEARRIAGNINAAADQSDNGPELALLEELDEALSILERGTK